MQKQFYPKQSKQTNTDPLQGGWQVGHSRTFEDMLTGRFKNEKNGSFSAIRITPVRAQEMIADVAVPAAQSLVWSVAVGLPSISVAMWMRWEWSAPLFIGACTILTSWISGMKKAQNSLMKTEEFSYEAASVEAASVEQRRKGSEISMVVVHEVSGLRNRMQIMEISDGVEEKDFAEFLNDIAAGRPLARKNWVGGGKKFSRDQYDQIIEKLLLASIITQSGSGGKVVSRAGKSAIAHMTGGIEI